MPLYDGKKTPLFGYNFDALSDMLATSINQISPNNPVTLVIHDFGSIYGFYMYHKYPSLVSSIISLDVGFKPALGMGKPSFGALKDLMLMGFLYQYFLITIWMISFVPLIGDKFSTWLFQGWAQNGKKFMNDQGNNWPSSLKNCHPRMIYSYFYLHLNVLYSLIFKWPNYGNNFLETTFPLCPMLYMYGAKKLEVTQFHTDNWLKALSQRNDCEVVKMENAFHWLAHDDEEKVKNTMDKFLNNN